MNWVELYMGMSGMSCGLIIFSHPVNYSAQESFLLHRELNKALDMWVPIRKYQGLVKNLRTFSLINMQDWVCAYRLDVRWDLTLVHCTLILSHTRNQLHCKIKAALCDSCRTLQELVIQLKYVKVLAYQGLDYGSA